MRGEPITFAKQIGVQLLRSLSADDKVAVLRYSTTTTALGQHAGVLVPAVPAFTDPIEEMMNVEIQTLETSGRADLKLAMETAFRLLKNDPGYTHANREQLIFILSDGADGATAAEVYSNENDEHVVKDRDGFINHVGPVLFPPLQPASLSNQQPTWARCSSPLATSFP
jgi:Mg-chelatase subunit ChlD